jgi:hypothetical protein
VKTSYGVCKSWGGGGGYDNTEYSGKDLGLATGDLDVRTFYLVYFRCRLSTVYDFNYTPVTLWVQSWRENTSGGRWIKTRLNTTVPPPQKIEGRRGGCNQTITNLSNILNVSNIRVRVEFIHQNHKCHAHISCHFSTNLQFLNANSNRKYNSLPTILPLLLAGFKLD